MIKDLGKTFVLGIIMAAGAYTGKRVAEVVEDKIYIRKQIKKNHKKNEGKVLNFRRG